jgi:hypothetical protein
MLCSLQKNEQFSTIVTLSTWWNSKKIYNSCIRKFEKGMENYKNNSNQKRLSNITFKNRSDNNLISINPYRFSLKFSIPKPPPMEKLRILNIFIIAFLISLIFQYFFFPKPTTSVSIPDITLSVEKSDIVVPNIPKITIHNTTTGSISIDTCRDISLSINSKQTTSIGQDYPLFCQTLSIAK